MPGGPGGGRGADPAAREALRKWRMEADLDQFRAVGKRFTDAGLRFFAYNLSFNDTFTDDEIEKGFASGASGAGDSGTSARVFGTFLSWMQEKTAAVFVIATANTISLLPPEMMRKGRFDEIFFIDLPTDAERTVIFELHLKARLKAGPALGSLDVSEDLLASLVAATEGFSGAEIEQVVIAACFDAFNERRELTGDDLLHEIDKTVPLSVTQAEQIAALRAWRTRHGPPARKRPRRGCRPTPATPRSARPGSPTAVRSCRSRAAGRRRSARGAR